VCFPEPTSKKNKDENSQSKKATSPVRRKSQSADKNNRPDKDEIPDSDFEDKSDFLEDVIVADESLTEEKEEISTMSDTELDEILEDDKSIPEEKGDQDNGIHEEAGTSKKSNKPGERPKGRPPNPNKNAKLAPKKTSPKKTGVKKVGRPKNEDQTTDKGSPTGLLTKPDTARRVSTRSKKPDEQTGGSKRR